MSIALAASKIVRALAVTAFIAVLGLSVVDYHVSVVDMDNHETPTPAAVADPTVLAQAAEGRTCTTEPVLTDTIVVLDVETSETRIVGFDAAYAAAKAGDVRVVTYCK